MNINQALTEPQEDFVFSESLHPAFVGGFGAGKTEAGITRAFKLSLENPQGRVALFAPTYDLIRTNFWGRVEAKAIEWGLTGRLNKAENSFTFGGGRGQILFKTMDNPDKIIAYEVTDAILDELDTLPEEKAREVWHKVNARCRAKKRNGARNTCGVTTTPEGFKLVYQLWGQNIQPGYELIKAPTRSNLSLPDDYVDKLRAMYPPQLLAAYLEGEFTNLVSGSVYPTFDKLLNHTDETIRGPFQGNPGEQLHVGLDFNVNNMTAIVCVVRNNEPRALRELTKIADTPAMCEELRRAFPGHQIFIYPDASGQNGSSKDASNSDLAILHAAGFILRLKNGDSGGYYNPKVKDRVASVNRMLLDGRGQRQLRVNTKLCPQLTMCLEQQVYAKDGTPDKTSNKDHANDAIGYFIAFVYPVIKPVATRTTHSNHMQR
jgi:hypothetical protein